MAVKQKDETRDPVVLYKSIKARLRGHDFISIGRIKAMRDSVDALGGVRARGMTYFSMPLNQGFAKPLGTSARDIKAFRKRLANGEYHGKVHEDDIDLVAQCPVLYLNANSNGLKPIARAMAFIDAGVRLEMDITIHRYEAGDFKVMFRHVVSSLTEEDKRVLDRFHRMVLTLERVHFNDKEDRDASSSDKHDSDKHA